MDLGLLMGNISPSSPEPSAFTSVGDDSLGLVEPVTLDECLRDLLPARSSSKRCGRGRRCVRSYRPHLLHTILPGLSVERRQEGGSVVWQLKQRLRRY